MSEPSGLPQPDPPGPDRKRRRKRLRRKDLTEDQREHRRRRTRRRGRRAYIRSVYSLPSLATLGNAICGFAAVWIAMLDIQFLTLPPLIAASYFIFLAMLFDAIDGRLARLTRHTTDFGGQLDSLADVVSFGVAPMVVALKLFHDFTRDSGVASFPFVAKTVWCIGALYMSCAMIRLARFNVSNEHGEQHHFSFLGLPSPGAAAVVASFILMQQDLIDPGDHALIRHGPMYDVAAAMVWLLPLLVLCAGLLMVSTIRYPHLVNRYLRGRRSIQRLVMSLMLLLLLVIVHRYTLGIGTLIYAFWGPVSWALARVRRRGLMPST
ncbi:MAG TPA: CDP-diacylglycerol--serine O-phosphatidyltransferase [Tepidisphaeraceae bacterium]|jgi:CDP-diacylglycerol--serine O-phosphatidyltransferase